MGKDSAPRHLQTTLLAPRRVRALVLRWESEQHTASLAPWKQPPTQFYLTKTLVQRWMGKFPIDSGLKPIFQRPSPSSESVQFFGKLAESGSGTL